VLEGLGAEREVGTVEVGLLRQKQGFQHSISLTEGALEGWSSDSFPSIGELKLGVRVPNDLQPSAAAQLIRDGISSIVGGGGLRCLMVNVRGSEALRAAVRQLLPTGTEVGTNFSIDTSETRWWTRLTVTRRS